MSFYNLYINPIHRDKYNITSMTNMLLSHSQHLSSEERIYDDSSVTASVSIASGPAATNTIALGVTF